MSSMLKEGGVVSSMLKEGGVVSSMFVLVHVCRSSG